MRAFQTFSTTAASNGAADATIGFAEGQAAATVNNSARALMARLAALFRGVAGAITLGGTSTALTFTSPSGHALATAYSQPLVIWAKAGVTCGASPTLNADGLGAIAIKRPDGTAAKAGDIQASGVHGFAYDGTYFVLLNPAENGAIGVDVQAYSAKLVALAAQTWAVDTISYQTSTSAVSTTTLTAFGRSLIDDADAATARATLGVVIGTNAQAYSAKLDALAAQTWAADTISYQTSTSAVSTTALTAFGRSLIDDADAATARATLGLVIGTNVQAYNANLTTFAGIAPSANVQTLLGAANFAAFRSSLGLDTGDTPTLAGVNIGNVDTTISRFAAGKIGIEGVEVLMTSTGMKQGLVTIPMLAAAMISATTNGPSAGQTESSTNKVNYKTLDFDTTTQEFAHFQVPMPKSFNNGTVTFEALWTAASGSGGVAIAVEAQAISDGDTIDGSWGTAVQVTDTLLSAGQVHRTATSAAITIGGSPAAGDLIAFRVKRVPADAADTLAVDMKLIAIRLFFTQNASDDS